MKKVAIIILITASLIGCDTTDYRNPKEVIKKYRELTVSNESERIYDNYLSKESKELANKNEFINTKKLNDSIKSFSLLEQDIIEVETKNETYKRFKIDETQKYNSDTIRVRYYYTLKNENGGWKVIWWHTLYDLAMEKIDNSNFTEAKNLLNKIIEVAPFSGSAYNQLAWIYYRDESLSKKERLNGISDNIKYAINLEPDVSNHYGVLAAYYGLANEPELEIENYKKAIGYSLNTFDKLSLYSNISGAYLINGNLKESKEYIKKAIRIDSTNTFSWFRYGLLEYYLDNKDNAIKCFEKAIKNKRMDNKLQSSLYSAYSRVLYELSEFEKAKKYILMALEIEPNNAFYKELFHSINNSL